MALVAAPTTAAHAQRGQHSGTVSTPFGPFGAAAMAQAGGNPNAALQVGQQKQFLQYQ